MKRRSLSLSVFGGLLFISSLAQASTAIELRWNYVSNEIFPNPGFKSYKNTMHIILTDRRVYLAEAYNQPSSKFGSRINGTNGENEKFKVTFHVVNGSITADVVYSGSLIRATISNATNSCDATIRYYLKPGQRELWGVDRSGVKHIFSEMRAENVDCSIKNE